VSQSAKPQEDFRAEASIPDGAVPLESILCTEELHLRPSRPPDYEKENRALVKLVSALADSPRTILQTLAETILGVTGSDSAGISLLTTDDGGKGSIGRRSRVCGNPISAVAHRAISGLAATCLIATALCYSATSNDATPISHLRLMSVC
jgi:hypothetical protein